MSKRKARQQAGATQADSAGGSAERQTDSTTRAISPIQPGGWLDRPELVVLLAVAAAFRLIALDVKAPHYDEGINGHFVQQIWRLGYYDYDPTNFHGPLYFYYLLLTEVFVGRTIEAYRAANGLLGLALIWCVDRHRFELGRGARNAAWLLAVSPAFVFYSRYAIHETLFVLGQVVFSLGFFAWMRGRRERGLWMMSFAALILVSTKETFFIFLGTWLIAWAGLKIGHRLGLIPVPTVSVSGPRLSQPVLASVLGVFLALWAALFSGFFLHWAQLPEFFKAFMFWSKTGMTKASGHEKPFWYWLELLQRYEWALLVGLILSLVLVLWRGPLRWQSRLIALVGFGTWLAYSLIPYKTPWLVLSMGWPLALAVGVAFEALARGQAVRQMGRASPWWRQLIVFFLGVFLLFQSSRKSLALNFTNHSKGDEPYVYVQSTSDLQLLISWLKEQRTSNPGVMDQHLLVLLRDTWPLPWVLSTYINTSYTKIESVEPSQVKRAVLILVDGQDEKVFESRLQGLWWKRSFQIRHSYEVGAVYLRDREFEALLAASPSTGLQRIDFGGEP